MIVLAIFFVMMVLAALWLFCPLLFYVGRWIQQTEGPICYFNTFVFITVICFVVGASVVFSLLLT